MPRTRRSFSAEFKAELIVKLLSGDVSQAELCRNTTSSRNCSRTGRRSSSSGCPWFLMPTATTIKIKLASPNSSSLSAARPMNSKS